MPVTLRPTPIGYEAVRI